MAIKKDKVSRETPPLAKVGPIIEVDVDKLEDRLRRMSHSDRKKLLDMLDRYQAVMLKNEQ